MATADKSPSPGFPPDILFTVVIVAAAFVIGNWPPLESSRPPGAESSGTAESGLQDVSGRLWEDPFQAVTRHVAESPQAAAASSTGRVDGHSVGSPCLREPADGRGASNAAVIARSGEEDARFDQLASWLGPPVALKASAPRRSGSAEPTTDIVGVMVFGEDSKEGVEYRRRARYSVVSGLSVVGQFPLSEVGLGYFEWPAESRTALKAGHSGQKRVPFERFHDNDGGHRVLLLWLDENALPQDPDEGPLARIGSLVTCLRAYGAAGRDIIIGPAGSQMLAVMAKELPNSTSPTLQIFSTATANGAEASGKGGIARAVRTDDVIMEAVIRELGLRGADVLHRNGDADRVVLVSEWDTLYGRSLPETFVNVLCRKNARCDGEASASWVHRFSYLRGLDGTLMDASIAKNKDKKVNGTGSLTDLWPKRPSEHAEGNGQFDYLRRLGHHIHTFEGGSGSAGARPTGRVAAIGVLGSDVYDKLLVLRALRSEFPKAVFFTSDLDARLLHQEESAWTRSLVVGSTFGFELHPDLQRNIPPFRDSYQTATFLAIRAAFAPEWHNVDRAAMREKLAERIHPRVFEIGRHAAFDLSSESLAPGRRCLNLESCLNVHPEPDVAIPWPRPLNALKWAAFLLLGGGFVYLGSSGLRDGIKGVARWWRMTSPAARQGGGILGAVIIVVTSATVAAVLLEVPDGEPFRLSAGVSMWPTEIVRYVAALLTIAFIVWVRRTISRVRQELGQEFAPDALPVEAPRYRGFRAWIGGIGPALRDHVRAPRGRAVDAWKLWEHYVADSTLSTQLQRVIPLGGLFWMSCLVIISFDWPQAPYRGTAAHWIDSTLIRFVCAPLFIWLMFSVSDVIQLGRRYARMLGSDTATEWPRAIVRHAALRLGLLETEDVARRATEEAVISRWLDVHVIARWTQVVAPLIYCPFIVLTLMVVSRSALFDRWGTPWPLVLVSGVSGLYGVVSALSLRRIAEEARQTALRQLRELWIQTKAQPSLAALSAQIEQIIRETESLREGAFAPFAEQPVVRAVLLPLGSGSGLVVLRYLLGWSA